MKSLQVQKKRKLNFNQNKNLKKKIFYSTIAFLKELKTNKKLAK
jgi:hypothetical protein